MNNMPQRLVFFALGVVINSFGVALITLGNLGTSAISSVPYVCSLQFPMFSFGVTTFIWNILLILVQVVLLRRDFKPSQFLQIMVNVLFSAMIDVSMAILGVLHPTMLWEQFLCIGLGCVANTGKRRRVEIRLSYTINRKTNSNTTQKSSEKADCRVSHNATTRQSADQQRITASHRRSESQSNTKRNARALRNP